MSKLGQHLALNQDSLFFRLEKLALYSDIRNLKGIENSIDDEHKVAIIFRTGGKTYQYEGTRSEMDGLHILIDALFSAQREIQFEKASKYHSFESRQKLKD